MSGPVFSLYYKDSSSAPKSRVEALLRSLTTRRQSQRQYSWMPNYGNGWELFLDEGVVPRQQRSGKSRESSTGAILLNSGDGLAFEESVDAASSALVKAIGFVPSFSWTGCAMAKSDLDVDGLYLIADMLAKLFGGFYRIESTDRLPQATGVALYHIEYRDLSGYFGSQAPDPEYVQQYQQYVPLTEYWLVDAATARSPLLDF